MSGLDQQQPQIPDTDRGIMAFATRKAARRILISVFIGAVTGLGAMAFFFCLEWARWFCLAYLSGAQIPTPEGEHLAHFAVTTPFRPWLLALMPALGGLLGGLLVYTFAPETEGDGTGAMVDSFHNLGGIVRPRVPFIKGVSSIITIATGGSAGREGPISQIGAGFGSWLAQVLKMPTSERRIYMLAGCAAGLGAIFRAPLGAAITSVEVLYSEDFESDAIIPCVIASVISYSMYTFAFGFDPIFGTPAFAFRDARELLVYAVLGLICAPFGSFYVKTYFGTRDLFRKWSIPRHMKPMIGGLGVGLIALAVPEAMGGGYGYLQLAIYGQLGLGVMCLAAVFKVATTSLTIGSGGSGGLFGPTLFIGGMIGGVVGHLGHMFMPEVVTQPGAYVLVGMAAFFAGAAKAPVGALIMVTEMAASYSLLPPLMIVSVIAIMFNKGNSIYEKQLRNKFQSPAHEGEMTVNVMEDLTVGDVFKPDLPVITMHASNTFAQLQNCITCCNQAVFPVLDNEGRLTGVLPVTNVRKVLFEDSLRDLVVVAELASPPVSLTLDTNLYDALIAFLDCGYSQMPVVTYDEGRQKLLGLLNHEDVISAYHAEVSRRQNTGE